MFVPPADIRQHIQPIRAARQTKQHYLAGVVAHATMAALAIRAQFGSACQKEWSLQRLDRFAHMPVGTQLQFSTAMYTSFHFTDKYPPLRFRILSLGSMARSFFHSELSCLQFSNANVLPLY